MHGNKVFIPLKRNRDQLVNQREITDGENHRFIVLQRIPHWSVRTEKGGFAPDRKERRKKKKHKYYIQGKLPLKLSLTLLTSKPHVPSGTPKFYAKEKNISRKKTAYLVILSTKLF